MTMSSINSLATLQIAVTPQTASPKGGLVSNTTSLHPTLPADVFANAKAAINVQQEVPFRQGVAADIPDPSGLHTESEVADPGGLQGNGQNGGDTGGGTGTPSGMPGPGDPSLNPPPPTGGDTRKPPADHVEPKAPAPPKPKPIVIQPQAYLRPYTPVKFYA
jgi:hypothetical protein